LANLVNCYGLSQHRQPMNKQYFDDHEIKHFESLAEEWWKPEGRFKTLHAINPVRLDYIDTHTPLAGQSVLDVGCGGGLLSEAMAAKGAVVTGIDRAGKGLAVARLHAEQQHVSICYEACDAETWAKDHQQSYDIITCLEVLEHVPDVASTLAACAAMLKPNGVLYVSTLNRNAKSYLFAILGAEYILHLLPRGTHRYAKFIRPSELYGLLKQQGLQPQQFKGMNYTPWNHRCVLSDDLSVNYLGHACKLGDR